MTQHTTLPAQSDASLAYELAQRARPWTVADYEAVRAAAAALTRTNFSYDAPNGDIYTVVDGPAFWRLVGALDRYDKDPRD